jgi:hypothetical protein
MNNKETDIRLPEGFSSWFAVAEKTMNQDFYNHRILSGDVDAQIPVFFDSDIVKLKQEYQDTTTGAIGIEYFESDLLTLKVRAFDELNEIIPDAEELIKMRNYVGMLISRIALSDEDRPVLKMIDKLISLKI